MLQGVAASVPNEVVEPLVAEPIVAPDELVEAVAEEVVAVVVSVEFAVHACDASPSLAMDTGPLVHAIRARPDDSAKMLVVSFMMDLRSSG